MDLHIFNPEHDIALAHNSPYAVAPHQVKEMRSSLGFLPALWAKEGDCVLVEDVEFATKASASLLKDRSKVMFVDKSVVHNLRFSNIYPWGWDRAICFELLRDCGIDEHLLPSEGSLENIRFLSSRERVADLLPIIREGIESRTTGIATHTSDISKVEEQIRQYGNVVLKAPWSSSGRGIRYVAGQMSASTKGWLMNVIRSQGGVMVEPYYRKVRDLAMEFFSECGKVRYLGLSLFLTKHGKYLGNVIASEKDKQTLLLKYFKENFIEDIKLRIINGLEKMLEDKYTGPLGVDMMIVASPDEAQYLLHPCLEVNLRRTMGHVAASLLPFAREQNMVMSITKGVNYRLKVRPTENNFVNVL